MEDVLAKNAAQGKSESTLSDQSASSKEGDQSASSAGDVEPGEKVVTSTVIGKPDWGEADATHEPAPTKTDQNKDDQGETDQNREEKKEKTIEEKEDLKADANKSHS